jgi:hypothetical protein
MMIAQPDGLDALPRGPVSALRFSAGLPAAAHKIYPYLRHEHAA